MKRLIGIFIFLVLVAACTTSEQYSNTDKPTNTSISSDTPAPTYTCSGTVAFVSDKSGRPQIYKADCDGSNWVQLTTDAYDNYAPAWSPDGKKITFYKHFSWQSWAIFIMDADGSNPQQITPSDGSILCSSAPEWSPDGTKILFMVDSSNQPTCEMKTTDIAVINVDGSDYHLLTNSETIEIARGWSPDGSRIIYHAIQDGDTAIWSMNSDGTNPIRLTDSSSNNSQPVISPDGNQIVFISDRNGSDQVYLMNLDGSHVTQLTTDDLDYNWPTWSPDGSQILFSAGDFRRASVDLYVINTDGTRLKQLTTEPGLEYEASWTVFEDSAQP